MDIDDVNFTFKKQEKEENNKEIQIKYSNVEIELRMPQQDENQMESEKKELRFLEAFSDFKEKFLFQFYQDLREWKHSKFVTIKALDKLVLDGFDIKENPYILEKK